MQKLLLVAAAAILVSGCAATAAAGASTGAPASTQTIESSPAPAIVPVSTPPWVVVDPACKAPQLAAQLQDIEFAGDQTFAWIVIRDISSTGCQLTGHIGLVGVDSTGATDTETVTAPVAGGLLLSAKGAPVIDGTLPPATEHVAFLVPDSSQTTTVGSRVDSDCTQSDQVTPTEFQLDVDGTGTVAVVNSQNAGPFGHLEICQGQLSVSTVTSLPN